MYLMYTYIKYMYICIYVYRNLFGLFRKSNKLDRHIICNVCTDFFT